MFRILIFICIIFTLILQPDYSYSVDYCNPTTVNFCPDLQSSSYSGPVNGFAERGYGGQCTSFAWGRAHELGKLLDITRGHATTWYDNTKLPKSKTIPKNNSIAVWDGGEFGREFGHVAYIVPGRKRQIQKNCRRF